MARSFEDLLVWRKARQLTLLVYEVTRQRVFASDRPLQAQMRRAAVSVMSNIAEGFERDSAAELGRFLTIAKGSCGELRCQLHVALDQRYIDLAQFQTLSKDSIEVSRMLHGLRKRAQERRLSARAPRP